MNSWHQTRGVFVAIAPLDPFGIISPSFNVLHGLTAVLSRRLEGNLLDSEVKCNT